jgi:hypothetical protein
MNRLSLALMSRWELVDTSVRVCQENERLARENAALKERVTHTQVRCEVAEERRRDAERALAKLEQFVAVIEPREAG